MASQNRWRPHRIPKYEILLLGDPRVGKEAIVDLLVAGDYAPLYLDEQRRTHRRFSIDNQTCIIKFHTLSSIVYSDYRLNRLLVQRCDGIFIVYDVCNRKSFENVNVYWDMLKRSRNNNARVWVLGNKIDQVDERRVARQEASNCAMSLGIEAGECSAKSGDGVEETLFELMRSIMVVKEQDRVKLEMRKQEEKARNEAGVSIMGFLKKVFRTPREE